MKKKTNKCIVDDCIPTPTSCNIWSGGDIEYLGICDGDPLNNLLWEVVNKLEDIAGNDLAEFDLDSLLEICNQTAPLEVTLISILNIIKANQICLKDFVDELNDRLGEIINTQNVDINLKCYANIDNLGNSLAITRAGLDQLVIDNLCNQKGRIEFLEGKAITLQSQIDNISNNSPLSEQSFGTCIDSEVKPTSSQVISVANDLCSLRDVTGNEAEINIARNKGGTDLNVEFGLITGWELTPSNWAEDYGNLKLEVEDLRQRLIFMEENCCATTCKDVGLGFTALFNEDMDGIIVKFTAGAGTEIPAGFIDKGSTGTITDKDGNIETFTLVIANNSEIEIPVTGLNLGGNLTIEITAILGTPLLTCQKCLTKIVKSSACGYCRITATGDQDGSAIIIYTDSSLVTFTIPTPSGSTTTTTTAGS